MTRIELKCLMAASIAAGYRAGEAGLASDDREWVVRNAVKDAEAILDRIEKPIIEAELVRLKAGLPPSTNGEAP